MRIHQRKTGRQTEGKPEVKSEDNRADRNRTRWSWKPAIFSLPLVLFPHARPYQAHPAGRVTSDGLLDKKDMFEHLIIGGGVIGGMEFASVPVPWAMVTVIEALDRILPTMDKAGTAQNLKMIMKKRNVDIHTGQRWRRSFRQMMKRTYAAIRKGQNLRGQGTASLSLRDAGLYRRLITDESSREVKDMAMFERGVLSRMKI